jgi:16S rRNA A1518/A1519 N6-dimethyltransferase RsmA/KsgA/DIM1 with predicted DNA glycosylase/AP lyase activity
MHVLQLQVEAGLQKVGLSTRARAQELSLEQHVALAHALEGSKEDKVCVKIDV